MPLTDGILVNLQSVLTVFEIIRDRSTLGWKLARLSHRDKSCFHVIGKRRSEYKTARLNAYYGINLPALELSRKRINRASQTFRVFSHRRYVIKIDSRLR